MIKVTAQEVEKTENGRGYELRVSMDGSIKQLENESVAIIHAMAEGIAKDTPFSKGLILASILERLADSL